MEREVGLREVEGAAVRQREGEEALHRGSATLAAFSETGTCPLNRLPCTSEA